MAIFNSYVSLPEGNIKNYMDHILVIYSLYTYMIDC
jgi:hypothetical protein